MNQKKPETDKFVDEYSLNTTADIDPSFFGLGYAMTEGYRLGGDLLLAHIESEPMDRNLLCYPLFFLFRHSVELQLKSVITSSRSLLGIEASATEKETEFSHALGKIWSIARPLMFKTIAAVGEKNPQSLGNDCCKVQQLVDAINGIDKTSTAMRFPKTKDGKHSLHPQSIGLVDLRKKVNAVVEFLEQFDGWTQDMIQERHQLRGEIDCE